MNSCIEFLGFHFLFSNQTNLFTFEFSEHFPFKIIYFSRLVSLMRAAAVAAAHSMSTICTHTFSLTYHDDRATMRPSTVFICGREPRCASRCNVQFYDTTNAEVDAARATRRHIGIIGLQFSAIRTVGIRHVWTDG